MLASSPAFSGFSVDDTAVAARFYGEVLGLQVTLHEGMLLLHLGEGPPVLVYPKDDHVPATYTVLNFPVADIDAAVAQLRERGVEMTRYAMVDADGISRSTDPRWPSIAWFTDPAGNILSVLEDAAVEDPAPEDGPPSPA